MLRSEQYAEFSAALATKGVALRTSTDQYNVPMSSQAVGTSRRTRDLARLLEIDEALFSKRVAQDLGPQAGADTGVALDAATLADRKVLVKTVIAVAKLSASLFAVWAHAGPVASTRGDPVTEVCETTWAAIRSDVAAVARSTQRVREASDPVAALREVAALWPEGEEAWTAPPL
jgi:hypothetical protein